MKYFCAMEKFNLLRDIITDRRSVKPAVFNGKKIENNEIRQLLHLANWAPSHGLTEPWRFIVYSGDAVQRFCSDHAELYRQRTTPEKFTAAKYEKQKHNGDKASHLVIAYMHRGSNPNITELEEICATAAAVQNILLGAESLGLAVLWSTGGLILDEAIREYLGLHKEDIVIGMLYLGYTDEPAKPGKRQPIEEKIIWHQK
jgi:nitroreductase